MSKYLLATAAAFILTTGVAMAEDGGNLPADSSQFTAYPGESVAAVPGDSMAAAPVHSADLTGTSRLGGVSYAWRENPALYGLATGNQQGQLGTPSGTALN